MAKYVRITARPTVDNPDEFPLYVDLILDDNDKVLGNYPFLVFKERLDRNRVLRCRSFYTQTDEWILAKSMFLLTVSITWT